ncbi:MAG TPA: CHAD domain-containing protein [Anaeromyxobacter sp.]|nr:CHAD domain-containing protein [Anaeromyxobacter sp.]
MVQALLRDAEEELAKLESGASEEALHDFRVALRRLRSQLRALRPSLARRLRRKHERRLKAIAGATSETRDAEVQLRWLGKERESLAPRDVPGLDWLAARLEKRQQAGYEQATRELSARFRRLARKLERSLARPAAEVTEAAGGPAFGEVLAAILRTQVSELLSALGAVSGPFDVTRAHAARIAGKRLRYQLEPLRGNERGDATEAVTILKELQDLLGELHDAHVLGDLLSGALAEVATERARRAHAAVLAGGSGGPVLRLASRDPVTRGLLALDVRVAERATAAHSGLVRDWLPSRREALVRAVSGIADALAPRSTGRAGGMRRFLLLRLPEGLPEAPDLVIEKGWLPGPTPRDWLLRIEGRDGARHVRGGGRALEEEEIPEDRFSALWPGTAGARLVRHRRLVVRGGQSWTVDVVGERGPVLAEIAAPPGAALDLPRWLRPVVVREVTGEKDYEEERLAARRRRLRALPAVAEAPPAEAEPAPEPSAPVPPALVPGE